MQNRQVQLGNSNCISARACIYAVMHTCITATDGKVLASCMQGLIQPMIPSNSEASVFAVYNDRKQLQYIGFSKDLYNSLRTLLGRRPDKAFFYKYEHQHPCSTPAMCTPTDLTPVNLHTFVCS